MRDENIIEGKAQVGIFVRAALTVRDQRIELTEEGASSSFTPSADGGRAKSPTDHRFVLLAHPIHSGRRGKITRVGFHDQRVGIPLFQPVRQSALITQIKIPAKQMYVFP